MDRRERFVRASAGQVVDHPPVGFWIHYGSALWPPSLTAEAHLRMARDYDLDFIKVIADYRFPTVDDVLEVTTVDDLRAIGDPGLRYDNLRDQAELLRLIHHQAPDLPIIDTVFSPFETVVRTLGPGAVPLLRDNVEVAHEVIGNITTLLTDYLATTAGTADAMYLAVNDLNFDSSGWGLTTHDVAEWIAPYDRQVLQAAHDRVRIIHVHDYNFLQEFIRGYPAEVLSWSASHSDPTLTDITREQRFVPMCGLDETHTLSWTPTQITHDVLNSRRQTHDRIILTPGCTIHSDTPPGNMRALVEAARLPL